jgi:hypothetical protein
MNGGITKISCEGIPTVNSMDALEVLSDLIKSLFPSEALPTIRSAAYGISQAVLIIVKVLQGRSLRADVTAAEWVVFITANVQTFAGLNSDLDPTDRFAEIAVAIMNRGFVGGLHGSKFIHRLRRLLRPS